MVDLIGKSPGEAELKAACPPEETTPFRRIAVIALTKNGMELAWRISVKFKADGYCPAALLDDAVREEYRAAFQPIAGAFQAWVGTIFGTYQALIFIMACGIVVRSIAPYLKDKMADPAVLVLDEKGDFVISLLSGHWGGANELARELAEFTRGQAVLTTATDVNGLMAFDTFARKNQCALENRAALKRISGMLVNGGLVTLFTDCRIAGTFPPYILAGREGDRGECAVVLSNSTDWQPQFENVLYLRPRNLILGIGCKKGIAQTMLAEAVTDFLARNCKSPLALKKLVSIELKANETAIVAYSREKGLPYLTLPVEQLKQVEEQFSFSSFVKQTVGVGGVAEACAVLGGENTRLIAPKTRYPGITLALAEEEQVYRL
jgi:cobalt-precorrin 5A hydrolase